jgi:cold shock CspA family protein
VRLERLDRHHRLGGRYHVRIAVTVPGDEVVVSHEASQHATAQDLEATRLTRPAEPDPERKRAHVAVHEAFAIARRQLQDYVRRRRRSVKTSSHQARGRVSEISRVDRFGYITAESDGHQVYFQPSAMVRGAFERLIVGSDVSFVERRGDKGPQASTVKLLHPRRAQHARAHAAGR